VSQAWFGFLGVVVGAAVSLLGEQLVTRREREARHLARDQEQRDQRTAFQREAILTLQEAVEAFWELTTRTVNELLAAEAAIGRWPPTGPAHLPVDFNLLHVRVDKHRARVFDDELRSQARYILLEASHAILGPGREAALDHSMLAGDMVGRFQDRVNIVLKELI
jgi:hypothetical protein